MNGTRGSATTRTRFLGAIVSLLLFVSAIPMTPGVAAASGSQVALQTWVCADSFDGSSTTDIATFQANCTTPGGDINFDVSVDGVSQGAFPSSGGSALWDVPEGQVYVQAQPPAGYYSIAFCDVFPIGAGGTNYIFYGDAGAAADLDYQTYMNCQWYFPPSSPTVEYTEVTINKHFCSEGFDAYGADIYGLAANCNEPYSGTVDFQLVDNAGGTQSGTVGGGGLFLITWSNVTGPSVTVTEQIPSDYTGSRVFCNQSDSGGNNDTGFQEYNVQSGQIAVDIQSGLYLYCDWFNVPDASGEIYINKHWCPKGYDAKADPYDLAANCNENYGDPVTFELYGDNAGSWGSLDTSGTPSSVYWQGIPGDRWTVTEQAPAGYDSPYVYCKEINLSDSSEGSYEQVETGDGPSISWDLATGYQLYCDWFNVYSEPYTGVYVTKHLCPTGYDTGASYEKLLDKCTDSFNDIEFETSWQGGSKKKTTDGPQLGWEQLPVGDVSVRETVPSGYGKPVVYCAVGSYQFDVGAYDWVDVSSEGAIEWSLFDYEYLICDWFNFPSQGYATPTAPRPSGPATLTIVKYVCPYDYDVLDWESEPVKDCDKTQDGVTFTLSSKSGQTKERESGQDGDGTLTFTKVKAGEYLLQEEWPESSKDDLDYAFVYACESSVRSFDSYPFYPFAMIGKTFATRISLLAGEQMTCSWYNVPKKKGGNGDATITIVKFACPGNSVNPSACDPAGAGIDFTVESLSGDDVITATTGVDGTVEVDVPAGDYVISEDEGPWCFASSDAFNDNGEVTVDDGEAVEVQIYNCGA